MKILLIGSGGREHALAAKISESPRCEKLFIAPGNPGTGLHGQNIDIPMDDFEKLFALVQAENISLIVVGPEQPLANGITDFFRSKNVPIVGPDRHAAQLESSKDFAKKFMSRNGIPTAAYQSFSSGQEEEARQAILKHSLPVVVKASGLAAGKGVVICQTAQEAAEVAEEMLSGKALGASGTTIVIEEFLDGIELSVFVLTDGKNFVLLPEAKDYKRIGVGDTGPNTGGMGAVSPVPFADEAFLKKVKEQIIVPTMRGIQNENFFYRGFIFFGLIKVKDEPYVIEYNVRLGDPETEVVVPRIESDLAELLWEAATGNLKASILKVREESCATIMLVSGGYPGNYLTGFEISGLNNLPGSFVYHAGTSLNNGKILTNGGRVISVTSYGQTIKQAVNKSLETSELIQFTGKYYRHDIGKDLEC